MKERKVARRFATKKRVIALVLAVGLMAALAVAAGCAPAAKSDGAATPIAETGDTDQEVPAGLEGTNLRIADFQQRDAGPLTDEYNVPEKVNWGNRGCDACHEDLQATVKDLCPTVHIMTTGAIFGKTVDWNDCESCHSMHDTRGGVYLSNFMHSTHYSSPIFTDEDNGNCWSCHANAKDGSMVMFDEYCYDPQFNGYVGYSELSERFFHMRGYDADDSIGVTTLASDEVNVDVKLDQAVSPEEERYEAVNFNIPEWSDADFQNWTIEITGVKNPRTFTLAELASTFEKHTQQVTQECLVNGVNSSLEDSFECSGYLMEDIIEYCGGVDGEATTMRGWADDGEGWDFCVELEDALRNGSMIAVEYYGHELTAYQGAPAVLVQPGFPGGTWVKYLKKVQIGTDDVTAPIQIVGGDEFYANPEDPHLYTCNSAWFNPARDGQVFKVGEPIDLQGFAWVWNLYGHSTDAVRLSWDFGNTWVTTPVAADADPNNWQRFYATWTPTEPGTYCLKVEAVDAADGWHQKKPASVMITVEE